MLIGKSECIIRYSVKTKDLDIKCPSEVLQNYFNLLVRFQNKILFLGHIFNASNKHLPTLEFNMLMKYNGNTLIKSESLDLGKTPIFLNENHAADSPTYS